MNDTTFRQRYDLTFRTKNWTFSVINGPTSDTLEFAIIDRETQDLQVLKGNFGDTVAVLPTRRVVALAASLLSIGDTSTDRALDYANEALRSNALDLAPSIGNPLVLRRFARWYLTGGDTVGPLSGSMLAVALDLASSETLLSLLSDAVAYGPKEYRRGIQSPEFYRGETQEG
jgi:hypothetical protein